jgi:hypothetical protein
MDSINMNANSLLSLLWASKLGAKPNFGSLTSSHSWPQKELTSDSIQLIRNDSELQLNDENKNSIPQHFKPLGNNFINFMHSNISILKL